MYTPPGREGERVQAAFYGAGGIAERHVDALRRTGRLDVAWLISRSPEHAEAFAARKGIPRWTTDEEAPLRDPAVDVAIVAYPTFRHADLTLRALAAGKHVVCEKPLAGSGCEAERLATAAREAGKLLLVTQIRRYWPSLRAAHDFVHSGRAGGLVRATADFQTQWDWNNRRWRLEDPGGYFMDMHVHDVDLLLWWTGRAPSRVWAAGENRAEREGTVVLDFGGPTLRYARLDFCGRVSGRPYPAGSQTSYQLVCERGRMEIGVTDDVVAETFLDGAKVDERHTPVGQELRASWDGMWGALAAALAGEAPLPVPLDEVVQNVAVSRRVVDALAGEPAPGATP